MKPALLIGVVGPCKSGKTTLVAGLEQYGHQARQIAQEHSFAPTMWQQIGKPDVLIYLDASYETILERGLPNWKESEYREQLRRLHHARTHANLYIDTESLTPAETLQAALYFLENDT